MSTKLENASHELKVFIPSSNEALRAKFDALMEEVKAANVDNIVAYIPITYREKETINISNVGYDPVSGDRKDQWDNEHSSKAEYEAKLEKLAVIKYRYRHEWLHVTRTPHLTGDEEFNGDEFFESEEAALQAIRDNYGVDPLNPEDNANGMYFKVDDRWIVEEVEDDDDLESDDPQYAEVECFDKDSEAEAQSSMEEKRAEWVEEKLEDWDSFDINYDEFMWNWAWKYSGDEVDEDICAEVGLGVLQITEDDHEEEDTKFFSILTIGMDMSPKIMAYEALAYGAVREDSTRHLKTRSDRQYARSVIGMSYRSVMEKLGLERWIELDQQVEHAERMERDRIVDLKKKLGVVWIEDKAYGRHEVYIPEAYKVGDEVLLIADDKVVGYKEDGEGRARKFNIEELDGTVALLLNHDNGRPLITNLRKLFNAKEHPATE